MSPQFLMKLALFRASVRADAAPERMADLVNEELHRMAKLMEVQRDRPSGSQGVSGQPANRLD